MIIIRPQFLSTLPENRWRRHEAFCHTSSDHYQFNGYIAIDKHDARAGLRHHHQEWSRHRWVGPGRLQRRCGYQGRPHRAYRQSRSGLRKTNHRCPRQGSRARFHRHAGPVGNQSVDRPPGDEQSDDGCYHRNHRRRRIHRAHQRTFD